MCVSLSYIYSNYWYKHLTLHQNEHVHFLSVFQFPVLSFLPCPRISFSPICITWCNLPLFTLSCVSPSQIVSWTAVLFKPLCWVNVRFDLLNFHLFITYLYLRYKENLLLNPVDIWLHGCDFTLFAMVLTDWAVQFLESESNMLRNQCRPLSEATCLCWVAVLKTIPAVERWGPCTILPQVISRLQLTAWRWAFCSCSWLVPVANIEWLEVLLRCCIYQSGVDV